MDRIGSQSSREPVDGLRVLIVDEHAQSAENLRTLLRGWGCGVQVCTSGGEAIDWAHDNRPQVALVSLNLPDMRGGDVAHRLCCGGKEPCGLLLISLSTEEQGLERARANALGFDFHLIEPIDADEFRRALVQMARDEHLAER